MRDVEIEFTEQHYQNLVTYKMFTSFVRPILQKENVKAPSSKIMMLCAAKWREFCEENPNLKEEEPEVEKSEEEEEPEEEPELEYQPKPSRSRRAAKEQEEEPEEEESDEEDVKKKKRTTARSGKRGKKQKVPTLKIKFGKKKDQSSDEEKVSCAMSFMPLPLANVFD